MIRVQMEFAELDCVIKDWNSGLIDFVGIRTGIKVWLCFKRGEKELQYYHSWQAGFLGRQSIDFD